MSIGNRFGINTYSYMHDMTAAACLVHLASLGVRTVELMIYPGHLWVDAEPTSLREIRRIVADNDMKIITLNTSNTDINLAAAASEMREYTVNLMRGFIRLAAEVDAQAFILGPGKPNPLYPMATSTMERYFFDALDVLVPYAERSGVELWAENMPFAFLPQAEDLMTSLDRYGADCIKVCYDVANAHFVDEDPVAGLSRVADRLRLVHISDTTRNAYRHDAVGEGDIDFARLAAPIRAATPGRPPVLEIITPDPDETIASSVAALAGMGL